MNEATVSVSSDAGAAPANLDGKAATPTEVEVKVGDKTIKVSPDVATALAEARKSASEAGVKLGSMQTQLNEVNTKLEQLLKPTKTNESGKSGETPLDVLLFTDPDRALKMVEQQIIEKVTASQNKAKSQADFWTEFYKENKELSEYGLVVDAVFNKEIPGYVKENLTVGDTIKKLGEAVKKEVLKIRGGKPTTNTTAKPVGEGGNESGNSDKSTESETSTSEQTTTGSIIAERREARRLARTGGNGGRKEAKR